VPKQASSGGKTRLGGITKQGNTYLRTLLFQGARSAVTTAHRRPERLSCWIVQLQTPQNTTFLFGTYTSKLC
jgi:transposase